MDVQCGECGDVLGDLTLSVRRASCERGVDALAREEKEERELGFICSACFVRDASRKESCTGDDDGTAG